MKEMQLHDNSEVIDYFGGETITEVKCQHGHSRYTFDRFMDMSLSFPTLDRIYSVSDLLRWNLRPEYIENLECDTCQSKQTSIKSTLMYNSPPILVIHINRFYQGPHKNDKISIPVNFDEILEVPGSVLHDDVKRSKVIYQLIGVVNHYGVINSGHYYSDVRGAQGKWYQCNDETVVETKLLRQDNTSEYTYMLFYRKLQ
jgi:ubiquitin C-terminal hydrolase